MLRILYKPGAQWTIRADEAVSFPRGDLSRFGKAWFYFLCAKLMPFSHVSEVNKAKVVLLYSIVKGKTIYVGKIIYRSILATLRGGATSGLPHPSLICGLRRNAGVVLWSPNEIFEQPKSVLDRTMIDRFKE